jgi:hypothetical protein
VTTEETVTETNRLQALINSTPASAASTTAPPTRLPLDEPPAATPAPAPDFGALIRGYADHKSHCERLEIEYRLAMDRFNDVRNRLIEQTARLTEPVAYVMQDHPGLAYVMHPPAAGEKVGRMETTPLVLV